MHFNSKKMRHAYRVPCAGGRRPMIAVRHGEGILDSIIQAAGQATGKVIAAAPELTDKLIASGKAAIVPSTQRLGEIAGRSVADRATKLVQRLSKKDAAALPSVMRLSATPPAIKEAGGEVQKRAEALLNSTNVANLIHGRGLRLSPY